MKGLPRPPATGAPAPPEPKGGWVYTVRYVATDGQTVTRMFLRRSSADRLQQRIIEAGGDASVYGSRLSWLLMG